MHVVIEHRQPGMDSPLNRLSVHGPYESEEQAREVADAARYSRATKGFTVHEVSNKEPG